MRRPPSAGRVPPPPPRAERPRATESRRSPWRPGGRGRGPPPNPGPPAKPPAPNPDPAAPRPALVPAPRASGGTPRSVEARAGHELLRQPRLSRSGVPIDHRQAGTPVPPARGPRLYQLAELTGTPYERGPLRLSRRARGGLGQPPRPLEPHLRCERPGLGCRLCAQLALEPGGKRFEPLQCPGPIAGEREAAHERPQRRFRLPVELEGPLSQLERPRDAAGCEQLVRPAQQNLHRAPAPVLPLGRHPVVELGRILDAEPLEKLALDQS